MNARSSYWLRAAVVVGFGVALSGCSYLRSAAGISKASPDEFAVLTKGSLVIPPDFGLMPPKPGAAPTNQSDPVTSAQGALFGTDPAAVAAAMPSTASQGEKVLLANAGVGKADPQIRQLLAADTASMLAADDSFANDIMFWKAPKKPDAGKPVDADGEAKRLSAQQAGQPNAPAPAEKQDEESWFGRLFDWF